MKDELRDSADPIGGRLGDDWLTQVERNRIAVVIPCYRVKAHILDVVKKIGPEVWRIYAVDDCCPDASGDFIEANCHDRRIRVLRNQVNLGVGGAVMTGYRVAIEEGAQVIVKIDGDGQMDPALLPAFVWSILAGQADYTKGNRFFFLEEVRSMPGVRLFGNAVLSFMNKLSSGYWDIFDPTNGYTAIHANAARCLPLDKISQRYFFESDMLFRLNTLRAVVMDVPMAARYADEVSHLKISRVVGEFLVKHLRNFCKRIFYNYYLRDLSLASFELPLGLSMLSFGTVFGIFSWYGSIQAGVATPLGTIMLSALPVLLGFQLLLAFFSHDISMVPRQPIQRRQFFGLRK